MLRYSLENRIAPFVLAALLLGGGYYACSKLTIERVTDPTDTQVQVITRSPGQPAEEVERQVTIPLERALSGTPDLLQLRSISLFGLGYLTLTFADGVEPFRARQQTLERLRDADLPEGLRPSLGPMTTPMGEIYRYTLVGAGADPIKLRTIQDSLVRPQLKGVAGVADVVSFGGLRREIYLQPDPIRMAALGVVLGDLFAALKHAGHHAAGGYVERGEEALVVRTVGAFTQLADVEQVRISQHAGAAVRVKDVATVSAGHAPELGVAGRDLDDDAVEGIVLMRRGENAPSVLKDLHARVAELNDGLLPEGVKLDVFYDRTGLIDATFETVVLNLAIGAGLIVLVLLVWTFSWRATLIVAVAIPISLGASLIYLHARGMSANLLSIGAVDFGIIVNGAVIMVEHLFHSARGEEMRDERTAIRHVQRLAREVARPTFYALLIIIAAYLPIFALQRVEGRIFAPMAGTMVSALIGGCLVSYTLVPVLCFHALRKPGGAGSAPLVRWTRALYEPAIEYAMKRPSLVVTLAAGALASAAILLPRLGSEFLPERNEGSLYVTFSLPGKISLTAGRRLVPKIKQLLRRTPEVTELLTQLGRPDDGSDPALPNNLEVLVKLKPLGEWRPQLHREMNALIAELDKNLHEVPGIELNFSQPIRDNVNESSSGQLGRLSVKIYGDDLALLQAAAERVKAAIAAVPGVVDLGVVTPGEIPQLQVRIDRAALVRFDLDASAVQDYLETAMGGHVASEMWEGDQRYDVTVRLPPASREDVGTIQRLTMPLGDGSLIPLSAVAEVSMGIGRAAITREAGRRYVGVHLNVRNRDLGSFVAEAQARTAAVELPKGCVLVWGGVIDSHRRALERLRLVIPLALLLTFLLLFAAFKSVWEAALILLNGSLALIGGIIGLALAKESFSVSAAVGFLALLGQAVLHGVLVIAAVKARAARGEALQSAVAGGARDRLVVVLLTALLASVGLLPAALSHAIGSETQRSIAIVVSGGALSSALLALFVLPVTYYWASVLASRVASRRAGGQGDHPPGEQRRGAGLNVV